MTDRELDALLDGAPGGTVTLSTGQRIYFDRHELASPVAWRAAMRRALGHTGYEPPVWCQEDHDQIIRAMFMLADACAEEATRAHGSS
jgi:hypothetical protein